MRPDGVPGADGREDRGVSEHVRRHAGLGSGCPQPVGRLGRGRAGQTAAGLSVNHGAMAPLGWPPSWGPTFLSPMALERGPPSFGGHQVNAALHHRVQQLHLPALRLDRDTAGQSQVPGQPRGAR
ncbi:hypothetical protein RA210_U10415 [Rubrivivax sp. A210]|nr:hypothetical protein RA210_U10415 [Rubrivivax sp. A210]